MFMKKSQTVISTLNFHHVILFHASRAFPIVSQNVIDVLCRITHVLKKNLDRLKDYFLTRNYPQQVIDEAVGKVSSIHMDDAL